jgi:hypothetical protein
MWTLVGAENFEITRCIAVAGLFSDRSAAYRAITNLKNSGFTADQIGFVMDDAYLDWSQEAVKNQAGAKQAGEVPVFLPNPENITLSGNRRLKAGGTLASAMTFENATNCTLGQILISQGIEPQDANYFAKILSTGCILVTVESENNILEAIKILEKHGAVARLEECG